MYPKISPLWPVGQAPAAAYCSEDERLAVLAAHGTDALIDDPELAQIVRFAASLCAAPVALVSLVEKDRQHFVARLGLDASETPRPTSFCAHAMMEPEPMVIPDARHDPRFADNPLVTGEPHIRFYAGHPLVSEEGAPLGSLCVIDSVPRDTGLSALQREGLAVLAQAVMRRLSQQRMSLRTERALDKREEALKRMIDSVPGIAFAADSQGNFDYFNARWEEATGQPAPLTAAEWGAFVHEEDFGTGRERWRSAVERLQPYEDRWRLKHGDGSWRWMLVRVVPVLERSSGGARWFGALVDIDEAQRESLARELLAGELSHRIKNIFAVVSGLIAIRSRGKPEVAEFAAELNAAVRALGTAHDYVRPFDGRQSDRLQGLLGDLLAPYDRKGGSRLAIGGEDIEIGARAATPLALIFHELATNSAKYGALAHDEGRVEVQIALPCSERPTLRVEWRESSPEFKGERPLSDEGFGSRLLRGAIEGQLGGKFERVLSDDGLDVTIEVPVESIAR